jgi:hypothetical protein
MFLAVPKCFAFDAARDTSAGICELVSYCRVLYKFKSFSLDVSPSWVTWFVIDASITAVRNVLARGSA